MRRATRLIVVATVAPVIAALPAAAASADTPSTQVAVSAAPAVDGVKPIPDTYIVQLRPGASTDGLTGAMDVSPRRVYDAALNGFAAELTGVQLRELRRDPAVVSIEQDYYYANALDTTQPNPPSWGIDRIDQRNLPLSNSYTYNATGAGIHAYIIDTGIVTEHPDFGGRASFDVNTADNTDTDCQGHGTHVAGTVGSTTYGVAKGVRLHAVKMLDCFGGGVASAIVEAIDWVTANAQQPAVANTSWNFTHSDAMANAISGMIQSGVFLATSAGNTAGNSCDRLPRAVLSATAVASSTVTDTRSSFSSTGPCVDVYAPGSNIMSTTYDGASGSKSGTSMAAPHVAGVAALYKQTHGDAPAATVEQWIESNATPDVIQGGDTGGTANRLLFTAGL